MQRLILPFILLLILVGCADPKPIAYTPTEIEERFVEFCQTELKIEHVTTRMVDKTFWIYLPVDSSLFDFKAEDMGDIATRQPKPFFSVNYTNSEYKDHKFLLEYDIITRHRIQEPPGYKTTYSPKAAKIQRNIFNAIQAVLVGMDPESGSPIPDFVVLTMADTKKGLVTELVMYLKDYKDYSHGAMPYEEYSQRILNSTKGNTKLIGDQTGQNLDYRDITLPDFLAQQMETRLRFKYQQSQFPPETNNMDQVLPIIANTLRYYEFNNYDLITVFDIRENNRASFDQESIKSFEETKDFQRGRLINIKFDGSGNISGWDEEEK